MTSRLTAQLLAGPKATSVLGVLERCLAVQSQELRAGHLGVRARSTGLTVGDVEDSLATRAAVVTWVNRGTLHLIRSEDYPWLHSLTTPQLATGNATRLRQEGVSSAQAESAVPLIAKALSDGPLTRSQLREVLDSRGIPTAGQALVHLLMKATLAGVCVRGPMVGREQGFVLVADWLGKQPKVSRDKALKELGVRYLAGHGDGTDRDLAKWAGIGLRDARAALADACPPTYPEGPGRRDLDGLDGRAPAVRRAVSLGDAGAGQGVRRRAAVPGRLVRGTGPRPPARARPAAAGPS